MVLFKSTFEGELPAVEYPKINVCLFFLLPLPLFPSSSLHEPSSYHIPFPHLSSLGFKELYIMVIVRVADVKFYLALSVIYFAFGVFWGVLCYKHLSELLYVTSSPLIIRSTLPVHPSRTHIVSYRPDHLPNTNMSFLPSKPHPPYLTLPNHLQIPPLSIHNLTHYRSLADIQSNAILYIRNHHISNNRNDCSIRLLSLHQQKWRRHLITYILIRHRHLKCG